MKLKRFVTILLAVLMVAGLPLASFAGEITESTYAKTEYSGRILAAPTTYGTGMYFVKGVWKYYENGKFTKATGLVRRADNKRWCYVENGIFSTRTTLAKKVKDDGKWYYVEKGHFKTSTGLVQRHTDKKWFYVKRGAYNRFYTGLCKRVSDGKWFYVKAGKFTQYTGLSYKNKHFFYVNKGVLDWKYNGYVTHNGRNYVVKDGVATLRPYYNLIRPDSTKALGNRKVKPAAGTLLRYGPSDNYAKIVAIPKGTRLSLQAEKKYTSGIWYYTKFNGKFGWVKGKDLE